MKEPVKLFYERTCQTPYGAPATLGGSYESVTQVTGAENIARYEARQATNQALMDHFLATGECIAPIRWVSRDEAEKIYG